MTISHARTAFVRTRIDRRPAGPDAFVDDLLRIERFIAERGPRGVAATMSFLNLVSRYPREAGEIARELGTSVLARLDNERLEEIIDDRLRLAEQRLLEERRVAGEFGRTG